MGVTTTNGILSVTQLWERNKYVSEIESGTEILDFKSTAKSSIEVKIVVHIIGVAENV